MGKQKNRRMPVKIISIKEANEWYCIANLFAKSMLSQAEAIKGYNELSLQKRIAIQRAFKELDKSRNNTMEGAEQEEKEQHFSISVFVDAHIVATEFDTDPVVVLMCVRPPFPVSQRVFVK